ncbi:tyrosine-protein phosphatase [Isoptericola sp. NEAU-Y5]|uniref:Tyrosine-protein phosphatase n=1 Tax=Isoptericola luteus TaxID=2879484 RepID=A0ABS7ZE19_9MICO|nr:tyrosine-protein phosphatase [Isoptericola sp. NEAU-Y5]MCA5893279.1 tyrosine-protein phosphatase [Isoptericola sp. NEAU-Y5]
MTSRTAPTSTLTDARAVRWGSLPNARDLGHLPTIDGRRTRPGAVVRAPRLELAGPHGLAVMAAAGVSTVVDLRNADEIGPLELPPSVARHALPVEDQGDEEFMRAWGEHLDTPLYYPAVLATWPHLVAAAFRTIAVAPAGTVVVHCSAGRDRTGMITAMLLTLVGVERRAVVEDYLLAVHATNARAGAGSAPGERHRGPDELATWSAHVGVALQSFLDDVDVEAYLRDHGVTAGEIDRLRHRLLG